MLLAKFNILLVKFNVNFKNSKCADGRGHFILSLFEAQFHQSGNIIAYQ